MLIEHIFNGRSCRWRPVFHDQFVEHVPGGLIRNPRSFIGDYALTLFLDAFCVFETEARDPIGRRRKAYERTAGAEEQIDSRDAHGDHNVVEPGSNVSCSRTGYVDGESV